MSSKLICLFTIICFVLVSCGDQRNRDRKPLPSDEVILSKDTVIYNEEFVYYFENEIEKNIEIFKSLKKTQNVDLSKSRHSIPPQYDTVYHISSENNFDLIYRISYFDSTFMLDTFCVYHQPRLENMKMPVSIYSIEKELSKKLNFDNIHDFNSILITSDFDYCPQKLLLNIEDKQLVSAKLTIEYD